MINIASNKQATGYSDARTNVVAGIAYDVAPALPDQNASLEQLYHALESNRDSLKKSEEALDFMIIDGSDPSSKQVQAEVLNVLSFIRNIQQLVPRIQFMGGTSKFGTHDPGSATDYLHSIIANATSKGEAITKERMAKQKKDAAYRKRRLTILASDRRRQKSIYSAGGVTLVLSIVWFELLVHGVLG